MTETLSVTADNPFHLGEGQWNSSAGNTGDCLYAAQIRTDHWSRECVRRIRRLQQLGDNWDSYGARRVDHRSIVAAESLIKELAAIPGVGCPRIGASPAGYVALSWEWNDHSCELDVEVLPNEIRYSYIDENHADYDSEGETKDAAVIAAFRMQ